MAVTLTIFNAYKKFLFDGTDIDIDSDTIKVALCDNSYTPSIDDHDYFNDITDEISGGNYTAGGDTIDNASVTQDNTNDLAYINGDDVTWTSVTFTDARYGIIYKSTGTASTSPLIGYVDFGANKTITDGTFTISWHASGIISIT